MLAARRRRRRPGAGRPAAGVPVRVLDDLGQPPPHLRDRRLGRGALVDWDPPGDLLDDRAARPLLAHRAPQLDRRTGRSTRCAPPWLGWGVPAHPWAHVAYAMFVEPDREGEPVDERVAAVARRATDPVTAQMGLLWAGLMSRERRRHPQVRGVRRARGSPIPPLDAVPRRRRCTPSSRSSPCRRATTSPPLGMPTSRRPILRRLHAGDDASSLQVIGVMGTLLDGDLDTAERLLAEVEGQSAEARLGSAPRWCSPPPAPSSRSLGATSRRDCGCSTRRSRAWLRWRGWSSWGSAPGCCSRPRGRWSPACGTDRRRWTAVAPSSCATCWCSPTSTTKTTGTCPTWTSRSTACCWPRSACGPRATDPRTSATTASAWSRSRTGGPTTAASR